MNAHSLCISLSMIITPVALAIEGPTPCVERALSFQEISPAPSPDQDHPAANPWPSLGGTVRVWAAPDNGVPDPQTAVRVLGSNILIQAFWSSTEDPRSTTTTQMGSYGLLVPTVTGRLVADLISPDAIVVSDLPNTGTRSCGESCSAYTVESDWDIEQSLQYDFELGLTTSTETLAAGNAYVHAQASIEWIRSVVSDWVAMPSENAFPGAQEKLEVHTNIGSTILPEVACWALYHPHYNQIGLGRGGDCGAANAAISTIIRHEFGHLFTRTNKNPRGCAPVWGFAFDEGIADAFAALSLGTSCIGKDWRYPGDCLRDIEVDWQHPSPGNYYQRSRPLSGAFWDLYTSMLAANPAHGARDAKILFVLANLVNEFCWEDIRQNVLDADQAIFVGQYANLIAAAFDSHSIP
ncbi:MAG: hypothetical protein JSV80_10590 [Acidobacteriota bacterium]|nr:MAG: hypothetical protein JSV80_10590 [Acidobacteriota bacterium]